MPGLAPYAAARHGFLGLSLLGWISLAILWVAQAAVFWPGMETIRKFIDFSGPAVYVVMFPLAVYLVSEAGLGEHLAQPVRRRVRRWASGRRSR